MAYENSLSEQDAFPQDDDSDFLNQYNDKKNNPSTPQHTPYKPKTDDTNISEELPASNDLSEHPQQIKKKGKKIQMPNTFNSKHISSEKCFMGIAVLVSKKSKDPKAQSGACIVNSNGEILAIGHNGFPTGCDTEDYPWADDGTDILQTKVPYEVHAALSAILQSSGHDLHGAIIYVTNFPCNECAKAIIQSGIQKVIYLSMGEKNSPEIVASRRMLVDANVFVKPYYADKTALQISFDGT